MTTYHLVRRLVLLLLMAVLTLSACGSDDDSADGSTTGTPAAGAHNDADVTFAAEMVPHHAQALDMAELAADSAGDARVTSLASDIEQAQAVEITQMTGWLTGWGEGTPDTSMAGMPGMHHGDGMMTNADMAQLAEATGADFDRMWLEMMIRHHEGALVMARAELRDGANPAARQLAEAIVASQSAQIDDMRALLGDL